MMMMMMMVMMIFLSVNDKGNRKEGDDDSHDKDQDESSHESSIMLISMEQGACHKQSPNANNQTCLHVLSTLYTTRAPT